MKKFFYCLALAACINQSFAQLEGQARIDSLLMELRKTKIDTQKVFLMAQISFSYSRFKPDLGLKYGTMAYELAKKKQWEKGIGSSLYYRGANYLSMSKLPEALEDYLNALKCFEKIGNKAKLAGILSNIGAVYGYQQKNDKALAYFLKALAINQKYFPRSNFVAINLGNIGSVYYDQKKYPKALEYHLKSLIIIKEKKIISMMPSSFNSIGTIYFEMNNNSKAIYYTLQGIELAEKIGDEYSIASCKYLKGAIIRSILTDNNQHLLDSLYRGDKKAAINDAKSSIDNAIVKLKVIGDQIQLASAYSELVKIEEYKGNFKQALENFKIFNSIEDSVFTAEKNEKIMQSAMQYEFDKKVTISKAEQEKKDIRQRNIRNSITAGFGGSLLFLFVVYRQRNKIAKARKRSDELLLNILPEEVAEELKAKGSADAKQFDEVTVMFTDFKGFTQISEKLTPTELVAEIHTCFKAFDEIIDKYNIEKIKTIGDAYMCVGGLPVFNTTNAIDVINAAMEIQQFMQQHLQQRKKENKEPFEIRIGVHTGPVVAGIVGVKKFAYDIWGDTVNTASRMESSGEAGKINISGSTYELVKDLFNCTYRGKVQAKNKGEIDMYFVESSI